MKRPLAIYLLILLHLLLASAACYGGVLMILHPDGSGLGMNTDWLKGSPFINFLLPGIILLILGCMLPLFTVFGLWTRNGNRFAENLNLYRNRHWSWCFSLYTGFGIQIWIVVQQVLTDYFILQPMIFLVGMLILIGTLWPTVMRNTER